ncbi:MAG: sigma-70 family RNA polymerase sigma factor [Sandaracinus sp.]|nr:sigma-70 family RNA polymerase sigma factor [Sandaracinus sp.]
MPGEHEDRLIARIAAGETEALATLFTRHARAIRSVARAFAPDDAAVEDLVQETFLSVLRSAHTYRPGGSARAWLYAITRNAGRRSHRRDRELAEPPLLELGVAAGWGAPDDSLERLADTDVLARGIASLPPDDREVLVLRDVEGLSGEETAAALALTLPATKSRLHRARLRLMAAVRSEEGGVVAHEREVGGLTCGAVLTRLGDYVDGDLPAPDVERVDAHLRGCTVCERFGGRYARVVHAARERLGADHAIDDATFERVRAALEAAK